MKFLVAIFLSGVFLNAFAQNSTLSLIEVDVGRSDNKVAALVWALKKNDVGLLYFRGTPGNDAVVKINSTNSWERQFQFLQPSLNDFNNAGISVIVVGCPTDQQEFGGCFDNYRQSSEHAKDVKLIIDKLKTDYDIKKFYVMGHSSGNISSKWLSLKLRDDLAGGIYSSSMTNPYKGLAKGLAQSISNFDMGSIQIPTLNIHHERDGCPSSPYSTTKNYSRNNLVTVRGGGQSGSPCGNTHYHSFEDRTIEVSNAIIKWIKTGQVEQFAGE
jgi:hypothetical protein